MVESWKTSSSQATSARGSAWSEGSERSVAEVAGYYRFCFKHWRAQHQGQPYGALVAFAMTLDLDSRVFKMNVAF